MKQYGIFGKGPIEQKRACFNEKALTHGNGLLQLISPFFIQSSPGLVCSRPPEGDNALLIYQGTTYLKQCDFLEKGSRFSESGLVKNNRFHPLGQSSVLQSMCLDLMARVQVPIIVLMWAWSHSLSRMGFDSMVTLRSILTDHSCSDQDLQTRPRLR